MGDGTACLAQLRQRVLYALQGLAHVGMVVHLPLACREPLRLGLGLEELRLGLRGSG